MQFQFYGWSWLPWHHKYVNPEAMGVKEIYRYFGWGPLQFRIYTTVDNSDDWRIR